MFCPRILNFERVESWRDGKCCLPKQMVVGLPAVVGGGGKVA